MGGSPSTEGSDSATAPERLPTAVSARFPAVRPAILRCAFGLLLGIFLAATWSVYGPHILDDAYITFRYSKNLSEGHGLVYNPGERVQGSSTPLFSLVLGGLGALGLPILATGLVLSCLAGLATLVLLILAGRRLGAELAGWAAAFALTFQFFWVLLWVSGMETTLYCALILATLLAVSLDRFRWVGLLIAVSCLVRYDAALLAFAALAVVAWRAGWKVALRQALLAAVVYLPWFVFAWAWFGSPIPQTVLAKRVINSLDWNTIGHHYAAFFSYSPLFWIWLIAAGFGMVQAARRSRGWIVFPLWIGLYLAAFLLQRRPVMYYPWYLTPLLPPLFLMGAFGLLHAVEIAWRDYPGRVAAAFGVVAAALILLEASALWNSQFEFGADAVHRERKYREAAEILSLHIASGQTVYVGEVGTIGWFLPQACILDSAGLLSPSVYEIRLRDRKALAQQGRRPEDDPDGSPDVTRMVVEELQPDFITTAEPFLFIDQVREASWFRERYEPLEKPRLAPLGQVAFRRIVSNPLNSARPAETPPPDDPGSHPQSGPPPDRPRRD